MVTNPFFFAFGLKIKTLRILCVKQECKKGFFWDKDLKKIKIIRLPRSDGQTHTYLRNSPKVAYDLTAKASQMRPLPIRHERKGIQAPTDAINEAVCAHFVWKFHCVQVYINRLSWALRPWMKCAAATFLPVVSDIIPTLSSLQLLQDHHFVEDCKGLLLICKSFSSRV